jgi:NADPH:quinone reductase-like Zn-dependent oxidoreductase
MSMKNPDDSIDLVSVYRASKESVADIIRALLESEGIDVIFRSNHSSTVYDGIFAVSEGYWADLLVREDQAERAREIIHVFEQRG